MFEFDIQETEKPVIVREQTPNPFRGKFPTNEEKALKVGPLPSTTEDERKAVERVVYMAQKAANEVGLTARVKREAVETGTGKNKVTQTVLLFWSVEKITRKRKDKDTDATAETPASDTVTDA